MTEGIRELRLSVTASDYDAALRFYRDVLGLRQQATFTHEDGRVTILGAGRATLELADPAYAAYIDEVEVGRRVAGHVRVAFEVDDAEAVTRALEAAGATVVAEPVRTPWDSLNARLDGPAGLHLTVYASDVYLGQRRRLDGRVVLAEPDPTWAQTAARLVATVRDALGPTAVLVEHVGSTSVPHLPAKPVLDLLLLVPDPADEATYVPALEREGYTLHIREPEWHEHRLLKLADPDVNLHVFALGSEEAERMLAFRDHLRVDRRDLELYADAKRELAEREWEYVQDYADAKTEVVAQIMSRATARTSAVAGLFVLVTGPPSDAKHSLAGQLAERLGLPLLSQASLERSLTELVDLAAAGFPGRIGSVAARGLLAVAADMVGAVLDGSWPREDRAAVSALPGPVVEVRCGEEEAVGTASGGWPVIAVPGTDTGQSVEMLARRVAQIAPRGYRVQHSDR